MSRIALPPPSRLDVRELRLVLALAASGTTARAATALHLTQPAVSRALLSVEDKLGVRLFERSPRGLQATAAGQTLLESASRFLAELSELERRVTQPAKQPLRLRLVCECYSGYHWLPSALKDLRGTMPGLDVVLAVEHSLEPLSALEAGEIDVALLTASSVGRRKLEQRELFSDEVVFALAPSHPLAAKGALHPQDLHDQTLMTSHIPSRAMRWFNDPVTGGGKYKPRYQEVPLTEAILDFARAGMGIAVMSEWIAAPHLHDGKLVAKRLASGALRRPWRIAWRKEVGDAARKLISILECSVPRPRVVLSRS